MSTKIYNGYKITASSLDEVVGKLFGNKEKFKDLIESKIQEDILNRAINNYYSMCFATFMKEDDEAAKNESPFGKVISDALNNENDPQIRERDTVDVSICLIPQKQIVNNEEYYLLMLFAGEYNKELVNSSLWNSLGIEEFAYWDNTDPPEELTEYEWKIRGKQWEKELGYNAPSQSSLIIEFKKEYKYNCVYARGKEILIPMFEKSFEKINMNLNKKQKSLLAYYEEKLKDNMAYKVCYEKYEQQEIDNETKNSIYRESRQYSRNNSFTEEEMKDINSNIEKIKKIFKQSISFDNLFDKREVIEENTKHLLKKNKPKI